MTCSEKMWEDGQKKGRDGRGQREGGGKIIKKIHTHTHKTFINYPHLNVN